jgi:hypothetical protein
LNGTSGIVGSGGLDSGTASFSHSAKFTENIAQVALDYRFGDPAVSNY